jgi:hypothetical protein
MCRTRFARWAKGQKRPVRCWYWDEMDACEEGGVTDVEMVSVSLWWEFAAFFDCTVPAIVCVVFVDFLCGHVGCGLDASSSMGFPLFSLVGEQGERNMRASLQHWTFNLEYG